MEIVYKIAKNSDQSVRVHLCLKSSVSAMSSKQLVYSNLWYMYWYINT